MIRLLARNKIILILRQYVYLIIALVLTIPTTLSLWHPGLPSTPNTEYQVVFVDEFYKNLQNGVFYPRWAPDMNNGFGLPLFNYIPPLPNYIVDLIHSFGLSFIDSVTLSILLAMLLGVFFFYLWARLFWWDRAVFFASLLYVYISYCFVDIVLGDSIGGMYTFVFYPAFLWAITHVIKKKSTPFALLSGVFLASIIFSHTILAFMFMLLTILYSLIFLWKEKWNKKSLALLASSFILGISLSAIFWLPAIVETKYVKWLEIYSMERKANPEDLLNTTWMNPNMGRLGKALYFIHTKKNFPPEIISPTYERYRLKPHGSHDVIVPIAYFPGWSVFQDGKKTPILPTQDGLITFKLLQNTRIVEIIFLDTIVRVVADIWSTIAVLCIVGILLKNFIQKKIYENRN